MAAASGALGVAAFGLGGLALGSKGKLGGAGLGLAVATGLGAGFGLGVGNTISEGVLSLFLKCSMMRPTSILVVSWKNQAAPPMASVIISMAIINGPRLPELRVRRFRVEGWASTLVSAGEGSDGACAS